MNKYIIGLDLGGTKIEACLMDQDRKVFNRNRVLTNALKGIDTIISNVHAVVEKASMGEDYLAIGIGTPGTYDIRSERLYGSPHTLQYEDPQFIKKLRDSFNVPIIIENDANCLVLAEYFNRELLSDNSLKAYSDHYSHVMGVILGTGVGSGLILDNKLYRGKRGNAGEIGHSTIDYNGRLCQCGKRGCIEAYISGKSLERRYQEVSGTFKKSQDFYELYLQNDSYAVLILNESVTILSEVLANVVNIMDIEAIILGGGVSNIPLWYQSLEKEILKRSFGIPRSKIPILKAKMGDSAGVIGAGYLALRHLKLMDF